VPCPYQPLTGVHCRPPRGYPTHPRRALDHVVVALGPSVTLTTRRMTMYHILLLSSPIYQGVTEDHLYLLELSTFLEPKSQYSFDYTFQSIDSELTNHEKCEETINGPKPIHETIECTPYHWYTQHWWNCAILSQPANFNENELFDLFDYQFDYDSTIYSGDFLNQY